MSDFKNEELDHKLAQIKDEFILYTDLLKNMFDSLEKKSRQTLISYFSYSLYLPMNETEEHMIIGDFSIENLGTRTINNPIIYLRFSPNSSFDFSGKYNVWKNEQQSDAKWERIEVDGMNEAKDYWLKPINFTKLIPGEKLIFPNFQIKWANKQQSITVEGFVYSNEFKDGNTSLNQISIS